MDDVALLEGILEEVRGHPDAAQLCVVVLDEKPLFLGAEDVDFGDRLDTKQLVAQVICDVLELHVGEPVAGHTEHDRVNVTEFVIDERPIDVFGQVRFDAVDLASQVVPDGTHLLELLADVHVDDRDARATFAVDPVELRDLLDDLFDRVGDQLRDALWTRTREVGRDHRGSNDETRVHLPRRVEVRADAREDQDGDQRAGDRASFQRKLGQAHGVTSASVPVACSSATFSGSEPACSGTLTCSPS